MRTLLLGALPLLIGAIHVCLSQDVHFHCERSGQQCVHANSTCNHTTGQCEECPSTFASYDCSFNATDYSTTGCNLECQNGGTCYTNGVDHLCLCTPDFYGQLCDQQRVQVSCNGENMTVSVTPIQAFSGFIYMGDLNPQPECLLANDSSNTVYSLTISLDSGCHPSIDNDTASGDVAYTRELTLQYDTVFQSGHDLSINVTCFHSANQTREPGQILGAPQSSKSQGGKIEVLYQPAQLTILYAESMIAVNGMVTIGQRLIIFNYLNDDSVFKKLKVLRCVISNPSFSKSLTLISNGCPTEKAKAIGLTQAEEQLSPPGIKHEFSMIRFGSEPQVMFSCVVSMCQTVDDASCQMDNCNSGRRKRDVANEAFESGDVTVTDGNEQVTRTSLIVLDPNQEQEHQVTRAECLQESSIQAVIGSLASLVVIFFLLCLVVIVYFRRNTNRLQSKEGSSASLYNDTRSRCHESTSHRCSDSTNHRSRDKYSMDSGRFSLPSINVYR